MKSRRRKSRKAFLRGAPLFLALFATVGGVFAAAEIKRSQKIPGVDPLPLAPDNRPAPRPGADTTSQSTDASKPTDSGERPNTGRTELPPGDPGYPKIRNLTVVPEPTQPYTAKISWETYPDANTPIYLVRYSKPIVNRTLLYESYNLTSPPLPADTRVFLDRDMPEGTYYYAAVTSFELSKDGRLELRPGANYTIAPFVVYRKERPTETTQKPEPDRPNRTDVAHSDRDPNLTPADFMVKSLNALDNDKGVVLNWSPIAVKGIEYEVYRSTEELDTPARVEKAVRLGRVREDTPFFTDEAPVEGRRMYYGVGVRDTISGKTYYDLKSGVSYLEHTYRKPERQIRYESFLPESLTAFQKNADTIQLVWIDPGPGVKKYHVFRSTAPINTPEQQTSAKDLGYALPGSAGFTDTSLPPGSYFYALLPVTTSGEFLQVFVPGQTFTTYGVVIRGAAPAEVHKPDTTTDKPDSTEKPDTQKHDPGKPESTGVDTQDGRSIITGFRVELKSGNEVHLAWTVRAGHTAQTQLRVYRGTEVLEDAETVNKKGLLIGEFAAEDGQTVDRLLTTGDYYYTLAEFDPVKDSFRALYFSRRPIIFRATAAQDTKTEVEPVHPNKTEVEKKPDQPDRTERPAGPYDRRLDEILSGAFTRGQYQAAETLLEEFLADRQVPPVVAGRAAFHLGIVKFRLHNYSGAMRLFRDPAVQAYDRERASFWYRISLERKQK